MKKWISSFLILVMFLFASKANGQTITTTYTDPCTNEIKTLVVPAIGPGVVVMYRGSYKLVTAADIKSGTFQAWITTVTASVPCPTTLTATIAQQAAQAASSAASQAASAAASSA